MPLNPKILWCTEHAVLSTQYGHYRNPSMPHAFRLQLD